MNNRSRILLACLIVMHFSSIAAFAQVKITGKAVEELKPFDDLLTGFLKRHEVAGAGVAVAKEGKIIYSRGFGLADREMNLPVEPDSLFRIASISKPITGVAILQLVEQGKLKLDDRVVDLLGLVIPPAPKGDPRWLDITILHLLQHSAGFDRAKSFDPMFKSREFALEQGTLPPAGPAQVIASMLSRPLDFNPGERYAYSNFGYCLLGRVIEKVTGASYETYVKRSVLQPAGISEMRIGTTRTTSNKEVKYYDRGQRTSANLFAGHPGEPAAVAAPYGAWYLEAMDAHGGWIASAPDLLRFAHIADCIPISAYKNAKPILILSPKSVTTMFARPQFTGGPDDAKTSSVYYGCGWSVRDVGDGKINTWHNGALAGTSSLLVRRHDGLSWAVLFNGDVTADGKGLAATIDPLMHEAASKVKTWPK